MSARYSGQEMSTRQSCLLLRATTMIEDDEADDGSRVRRKVDDG